MPYRILCKMQGVTSPRYRNFLHKRENFCPTSAQPRRFQPFVTSIAAPIAIERGDPVPGRAFHHAVDQRFSRRTVVA